MSTPPPSPLASIDRPTGSFNVDGKGRACYSYPIEVPRGIGVGNAPSDLAVNYAQGAANGSLGSGWFLGGMSSIALITPSLAVDAATAKTNPLTYRFALDGVELLCVSGVYGASESVYRTEIDCGLSVAFSGGAFTASDRYGRVKRYGTSTDSQVVSSDGTVFQWHLKTSTDFWGNYMTYNYTSSPPLVGSSPSQPDAGTTYIASIVYTSNAAYQGLMSVEFLYDTRSDVVRRTVYGAIATYSYRLELIQTFANGSLARTYSLGYTTSVATGDSLIASITEGGSQGGALQPTQFTYSDTISSGNQTFSQLGSVQNLGPANNSVALLPMNVSGRSMADLVAVQVDQNANTASATAFIANPTSKPVADSTEVAWVQGNAAHLADFDAQVPPCVLVADMNNDGRDDVVFVFRSAQGEVNFAVVESLGVSSQDAVITETQQPWIDNCTFLAFDCDGDGYADIVQIYDPPTPSDEKSITVFYSKGVGNGTDSKSIVKTGNWEDQSANLSPTQWFPINFERNGASGLVRISDADDGSGTTTVQATVFTSDGRLFQRQPFSVGEPIVLGKYNQQDLGTRTVVAVDINGDGVEDILYCAVEYSGSKFDFTFTAFLSDGNQSFIEQESTTLCLSAENASTSGTFYVANVDGSQHPSVIYVYQDQSNDDWIGVIGHGTASATIDSVFATTIVDQSVLPTSATKIVPADINGVGRGAWLAYDLVPNDNTYMICTVYNTATNADYLSTVTDSRGLLQQFSYAPLSTSVYTAAVDWKTYQPSDNMIDVDSLSSRMNVISKVTLSNDTSMNSLSYQQTTDYAYEGAQFNRIGRGWLGFATIKETDTVSGVQEVSTYAQSWPLTSQKVQQDTLGSSNSALTKRIHHYPFVWAGPKSDQLVPLRSIVTTYSPSPVANDNNAPINVVRKIEEQTFNFEDDGTQQLSFGVQYEYYQDTYDETLEYSYGLAYSYGNNGQIESTQTGCWTRFAYNEPTIQMACVPAGRKITSNSNNQNFTLFEDGDISLTQIQYNSQGVVSETLEWSSAVNEGLGGFNPIALTYDPYGNQITAVEQASGLTTTYEYDSTYNTYQTSVTKESQVDGILETSYAAFDPRYGTKFASQTAYGAVEVVQTDEFGRKTLTLNTATSDSDPDNTSITLPQVVAVDAKFQNTLSSASLAPSSSISYNILGSQSAPTYLCRETTTFYDSTAPISANQEFIDCNAAVRWISSQDNGLGPVAWQYRDLDSVGNCVLETFLFTPADPGTLTVPPYKSAQLAIYDALRRPVLSVRPPKTSNDTYSVMFKVYTNGEGTSTVTRGWQQNFSSTFNLAETTVQLMGRFRGKLCLTSDTIVNPSNNTQNLITNYSRDAIGRILTASDATGAAEERSYNAQGSVATINNPYQNPAGTVTYAIQRSFDAISRVIQEENAVSETTQFTYDACNRVLTRTGSDGRIATYTYDQSLLTSVVVQLSDKTTQSEVDYFYDARGRMSTRTLKIASTNCSTTFTYDRQNQLIAKAYPDGSSLNTQYLGNRLQTTALTSPSAESWGVSATYQNYNVYGSPSAWELSGSGSVSPSNLQGAASYDFDGSLGELTLSDPSNTLVDYSWTYDCLDKIIQKTENVTKSSTSYAYTCRRLTSSSNTTSTSSSTATYTYDGSGNLTDKNGMQVNYTKTSTGVDISGSINSNTVYSCTYDAAGRTASRQNMNMVYDGYGKMKTIYDSNGNLLESFISDFRGQNLVKVTPTATTIFVDNEFQIEVNTDGSSKTIRRRFLGPDRVLATVSSTYPTGASAIAQAEWYMTDQKNSVTSIFTFDGQGNITETPLVYDDFGLLQGTVIEGQPTLESKETDPISGMIDFRARWYDPMLGRFSTPDSVLSDRQMQGTDGLNRMAFEGNDPINNIDPSGHWSWNLFAMIGLSVAAILGAAVLAVATGGGSSDLSALLIGAAVSALAGGGIAGVLYSAANRNKDQSTGKFWTGFGVSVAIGAVTGAIGSGGNYFIGVGLNMIAENVTITTTVKWGSIIFGRLVLGAVGGDAQAAIKGAINGTLSGPELPTVMGFAALRGSVFAVALTPFTRAFLNESAAEENQALGDVQMENLSPMRGDGAATALSSETSSSNVPQNSSGAILTSEAEQGGEDILEDTSALV